MRSNASIILATVSITLCIAAMYVWTYNIASRPLRISIRILAGILLVAAVIGAVIAYSRLNA